MVPFLSYDIRNTTHSIQSSKKNKKLKKCISFKWFESISFNAVNSIGILQNQTYRKIQMPSSF